MTYATTEAALLTLVQAYSSGSVFDDSNSSRGNFQVLDGQGVRQAAVLMMAGRSEYGDDLGNGRGSHGKRQQRHRIGVIVFVERGQDGDGTTYTALATLTDGLAGYIETYPRLNNAANVKRAEIVEVTEPNIRRLTSHMYQTIIVEVLCETSSGWLESAH
jgi:hypothetical protein